MSLSETRVQLIDSLKLGLSVLLNPVRIASVGFEMEEAAAWFQALAICNLLLYADPDHFYEDLTNSAHTRRYFLVKSRDERNVDDYQLAISRWDSFLDSVAAGYFVLARDIVSLSVSKWTPAGEYKDDFFYRYFLHTFIAPPSSQRDSQLRLTLSSWNAWLSGQPAARLTCCKALLERDSKDFEEGFDAVLLARKTELAKQSKMIIASDIGFEPRAQIFIEGLALLRMAKAIGLTVRADYPMCPAIARATPTKEYPADIFPELERERALGVG